MNVILKSTGQKGVIPDNKYDPNLFSQVNTPPQTGSPLLNTILSGAGKVANTVSDIFVPRSKQYLSNQVGEAKVGTSPMEQGGQLTKNLVSKGWPVVPAAAVGSIDAMGRNLWEGRGAVGEGLMYVAPSAIEAAPAVKTLFGPKLLGSAARVFTAGAGGGLIHGATDPTKLKDLSPGSIASALGQGVKEAPVAGATYLAAKGIINGVKSLASLGRDEILGQIKPQVGIGKGWPNRMQGVADEYFNSITANNPVDAGNQAESLTEDLGKQVDAQLSTIKTPVKVSNFTNDLGVKATEDGFNVEPQKNFLTSRRSIPKAEAARLGDNLSNDFNDIIRTVTGKDISSAGDESVTALDIHKGQQALGNMLNSSGAWDKLHNSPADLTPADRLGIHTYFSIKDLLVKDFPQIAKPITRESNLMFISKGLAAMMGRSTGGGFTPAMMMTRSVLGPISQRVNLGAGQVMNQLGGAINNPILQKILGAAPAAITGATLNSQGQETPETSDNPTTRLRLQMQGQ